tara:strand:+ start:8581 stop:8979 length:399 start_codon:yes stop_codon:yes gene_type:complete
MDKQSVLSLSILGLFMLAIIGYQIYSTLPSSYHLEAGKHVENEMVCMVNDAYMGIEQIPVEAEGKTYYGCCQMCEAKLKDSINYRIAQDPLTGEEVDKAKAYIVLQTSNDIAIYYFKSEENYRAYAKAQENK